MIATKENLEEILTRFSKAGKYAVDTETTGLFPYLGDRLFSIILADDKGAVYLNFQDYGDGSPFLEDTTVLKPVFQNPDSYWFAHNAKFDLAMLRFAGLQIEGTVHCTKAIAKVIRNDKLKYDLAALAKERGYAKDDRVEDYIKEHKLWNWRNVPGKKKREKDKYYNKVPFAIVSKYGLTDGVVTRALGMAQIADIEDVTAKASITQKTIKDVYLNELDLTKALFEMEWEGALIDPDYINEALRYEEGLKEEAAEKFEELTGHEFKDSDKLFVEVFEKLNLPIKRNKPTERMIKKAAEKGKPALGNPKFDAETLKSIDHTICKLILQHRAADKRAGTYYQSFLYLSDENNILHCNFNQDGTDTGRMSASQPNLQNVPKRGEDTSAYPVRKAFVPPPDYCLVALDYDQMEFRLMLEYSKDYAVIDKVLGGTDVHSATAETIDISRTHAKTVNFLLIYGGGVQKLADNLGVPYEQALDIRYKYFLGLPGVKSFIKNVQTVAQQRGFIVNWYGRRCHLSDPNFAFRMPNYLIQGGCADVAKIALVRCWKFLTKFKSKIILMVHDELVFLIHKDELDVIPKLKEIMETAYPYKFLPLTVGVDYSWKSWHDKESGLPNG